MNQWKHVITASVMALAVSCGSVYAKSEHAGTHWSYEGASGPAHWGDLKAEFGTCKSGKSQSPVNITEALSAKLPKIEFAYQTSKLDMINNGHTVQVNYATGSHITVGNKQYDLLQFHFHSPSEHQINGKPADMVAHLVHKASDGQLGVIAVLMKKGHANKELAKLWQKIPKHVNEHTQAARLINLNNLLPRNLTYYNYSGSLTTPPCSEGVNWMVLKTPVEVSAKQIAEFTNIFSKSVRPVQALNGRTIKANN